MIPYRYYIDSNNSYLALAIQSILDKIGSVLQAAPSQRMRILVLSEKKRIQDILTVKKHRIEEYDLIICSEPYYSLCRQYLGKGRCKIVSIDKGLQSLQRDLQDFIQHRENELSLHDVSQLMMLTEDEHITVTDYISQYDYKYIAKKHVRNVKAISRFKRTAMLKLGYHSNMGLWLAVNFLLFLGYITLYHSERNHRDVYHYRPVQWQDSHHRSEC